MFGQKVVCLAKMSYHGYHNTENLLFLWILVTYTRYEKLTHYKIDNLNSFRFQDVETSHGKLTLQVEYLPQLGFPTGSQKPILVISPLHSHTITRCHSDYSLVLPITSPESDRSYSFLSSSLNSSNNESNSMDDIIFTPDINIQLSSPIGTWK